MASYFQINGKENFCPSGTILAYIGSSTIDPPGWVIANNTTRTDGGSDNRYSTLITLSIGSGTASSYTPPNLQAMFLKGIGSQTNNSVAYTGATYKTKTPHSILQHTHGSSIGSHTHGTNPTTSTTGVGSIAAPSFGFGEITPSGAGSVTTNTATNNDNYYPNLAHVVGLIVNTAQPAVSVYDNTGNDVSTETRPFNFGVVWIIKL